MTIACIVIKGFKGFRGYDVTTISVDPTFQQNRYTLPLKASLRLPAKALKRIVVHSRHIPTDDSETQSILRGPTCKNAGAKVVRKAIKFTN